MIPLGFRVAGLTNIIGVLVFSLAFTNERLMSLSPVVFSRFGLISVMLWGAAYLAVATRYDAVPSLAGIFAVEKLVYVVTWVMWLQDHGQALKGLVSEAPLTGVFYAIYGPLDFAFGVFFAYVAVRYARRAAPN